MKKLLFPLLAMAAMSSCSESDPYTVNDRSREIKLSTSVPEITAKGVVEDTTIFDLYCLKSDGTTKPTGFTKADLLQTARRETSGAITFASPAPQYNLMNQNAYFYAFGAKGGTFDVNATDSATMKIDGKTDLVYTSAIFDAGTYMNPITTPMSLQHALAQIKVNVQHSNTTDAIATAQWGTITSIKIKNTLPTAQIKYAPVGIIFTGKPDTLALWNADMTAAASTNVQIKETSTLYGAAMIAPPSGSTIDFLVTTSTVTDKLVTATLDLSATFQAGKFYTITLHFNAKAKAITASTSVTPWGDGGTGNGSTEH